MENLNIHLIEESCPEIQSGLDFSPNESTSNSIRAYRMLITGPLNTNSYIEIVDTIDYLVERDGANIIQFDINSPGGEVVGLESLCKKIRDVSTSTTMTIAHIRGYGCSAAYRIAANCDLVGATADSKIGSIGAMCIVDTKKPDGVKVFVNENSKDKVTALLGLNPEREQEIQDSLEKTYNNFVNELLLNRDIDPSALTGKVYNAEDAKSLGLIDFIL